MQLYIPVVTAVAAVAEVAHSTDPMLDVALAQVDSLAGVELLRARVGLLGGGGGGGVGLIGGLVRERLEAGGAANAEAGVLEVVQDLRLGGASED